MLTLNQQKSKKVLLLCFVTFVTFVFYAHPTWVKSRNFLLTVHNNSQEPTGMKNSRKFSGIPGYQP